MRGIHERTYAPMVRLLKKLMDFLKTIFSGKDRAHAENEPSV